MILETKLSALLHIKKKVRNKQMAEDKETKAPAEQGEKKEFKEITVKMGKGLVGEPSRVRMARTTARLRFLIRIRVINLHGLLLLLRQMQFMMISLVRVCG